MHSGVRHRHPQFHKGSAVGLLKRSLPN
ncbi:unnamed protein product [Victoria cruziana]